MSTEYAWTWQARWSLGLEVLKLFSSLLSPSTPFDLHLARYGYGQTVTGSSGVKKSSRGFSDPSASQIISGGVLGVIRSTKVALYELFQKEPTMRKALLLPLEVRITRITLNVTQITFTIGWGECPVSLYIYGCVYVCMDEYSWVRCCCERSNNRRPSPPRL